MYKSTVCSGISEIESTTGYTAVVCSQANLIVMLSLKVLVILNIPFFPLGILLFSMKYEKGGTL